MYKEKIYDLLNKSHFKRLVTDGPGLKLKLIKDVFTVENLYTFETAILASSNLSFNIKYLIESYLQYVRVNESDKT